MKSVNQKSNLNYLLSNNSFANQSKIDKIVASISLHNPDLILFTETHIVANPKHPNIPVHPIPALSKQFKYFVLGYCTSNSESIITGDEPIKAIDSFRYHIFCLLRDLSIDQAKQNKKLINEIKDLSYKNQSPSKEASERLNEIITERILSSRERFYKFIAQSRHSPSKAMTLMSSESSISKRPRVEDADIHLKFWIDHFKNVDTYDHTPKVHKQNLEFFLNYVKSDGNILSNEASIQPHYC